MIVEGKENMERLTEKMNDWQYGVKGCGENCIHNYEYCNSDDECPTISDIFEKLGKLEDLEEQGKLHIVPCNVGDTVYVIPSKTNYKLNIINRHKENNRVYEQVVNHIEIDKCGYLLSTCNGMASATEQSYEETWFLSQEEAETALKEMQEGGK